MMFVKMEIKLSFTPLLDLLDLCWVTTVDIGILPLNHKTHPRHGSTG